SKTRNPEPGTRNPEPGTPSFFENPAPTVQNRTLPSRLWAPEQHPYQFPSSNHSFSKIYSHNPWNASCTHGSTH
ncbi:MAG TPA: hypothetical protein PLU80_21715, partial [Acidobacteriota bacterium]|nr:hypothetical protein [Acidobacteriota bacterium]